ncbi:hypothetical protein EMCRGX_G001946 [Ephydatia muelleri]
MATSFKKKANSKLSQPRGTRPSLHYAQALISTGVPSLDVLLGGGLPVGSVMLVEEDTFGQYSRMLLKYFLAEGVTCGHSLFVASASEEPSGILKDLPAAAAEGDDDTPLPPTINEEEESSGTTEPLQIAWRYQSLPKVQSSFSSRFGHNFDLTRRMEQSRLDMVHKVQFDAAQHPSSSSGVLYRELKNSIQETISKGLFSLDEAAASQQANVLRVAIESIGSALWLEEGGGVTAEGSIATALPRFLHSLRGTCRASYAVAMVTVPVHLFQDIAYTRRLERLCDGVVRLESFAGSDKERSPLYKEYHGLFHLVKLPKLNSLTCHLPDTLSLAFKLKRKKFTIEKLHLPPDLSGTANRVQQDGCHQANPRNSHPNDISSNPKHGVDF